jgi:transposase-like protein
MAVKVWCRENGVCEQTYYKWQKRFFEMAQDQQEMRFAEVTPTRSIRDRNVAVTVRFSGAEADIHSGADAATVETVLRFLKSC